MADHARHAHAAAPGFSLFRCSAAERVGIALVALALMWTALLWVIR
jgi:hypothetical protein